MRSGVAATLLLLTLTASPGCGVRVQHTGTVTAKVVVALDQVNDYFKLYCQHLLSTNGRTPTDQEVKDCADSWTSNLIAAVTEHIAPPTQLKP